MIDQERLLNGKDKEKNIVGLHIDRDDTETNGYCTIRYYVRDDNDRVVSHTDQLYPFFFLSDIEFMDRFPDDMYEFCELAGNQYYRYLVYFTDWFVMWKAVGQVKQRAYDMGITEGPKEYPPQIHIIKTPEEQYLSQSGKTMFKGMQKYNDPHRLRWDIETFSSRDGFPSADRWEDKIIIITLADNRGLSNTLYLDECGVGPADVPNGISFPDEAAMLQYFVDLVKRTDPDVMEGHNVFGFDFPYFRTRCRLCGVHFNIGRDGTEPDTYEASKRFAERDITYEHFKIAGRSIIDTFFETMNYDVFSRDLPGYGLKVVAKHFGFDAKDREYVEGDKISWFWLNDPIKLLKYAEDDTTECSALSDHLGGATFFLTQLLPMTYQKTGLSGTSSKIESLLIRAYSDALHSLPGKEKGRQEVGGYTDLFKTGVYNNIVYADVESLYPSIMLNNNVCPSGDELKLFPILLQLLTDKRFEAKTARGKFKKGTQEYQAMDSRQNSYKTLINSFYGQLGFAGALFNDYSEADRVTVIGQELLRKIIRAIREDGGTIIEVDTDGVLAQAPEYVYTLGDDEDKARAEKHCAEWREAWADTPPHDQAVDDESYVKSLTERMPEGIIIGFDGRAVRMISYKKKNYALREHGSDYIKFKGGSLISRLYEIFGRKYMADVLTGLMDLDVRKVAQVYRDAYAQIVNRTWDVEDFMKRATLKDSIETYLMKVKRGSGNGGRNRDAAYELAIKRFTETGLRPEPGDRIRYYIGGEEKAYKLRAFQAACFAEDWEPGMENVYWYLDRLKKFTKKFEKFFTKEDFDLVFSNLPIDEIDFDTIQILNKDVERVPVAIIMTGTEEPEAYDSFWVERGLAGAKFLKTLDKDDHGMEIGAVITTNKRGFDHAVQDWAKTNSIPCLVAEFDDSKGAASSRVLAGKLFSLAEGLEMKVAGIILDGKKKGTTLNTQVAALSQAKKFEIHISTIV